MPFELGLAVALHLQFGRKQHQFVLLEAVPNRLTQSLSDIAAFDPRIHGGRIEGVILAVQNAFVDLPDQPLQNTRDLLWVAESLVQFRQKTLRGVRDIFTPHPFKQLVIAARRLVEIRMSE
jgi:hypothetical protein